MLDQLLHSLEVSPDRSLCGAHWAADIRLFLEGIDQEISQGMPLLELGVENRPILKLTLLPSRLSTTTHLQSLPWLTTAQRGLVREIRELRPKFHYGLKLSPEGRELEIYVHDTPTHHFRETIFASTNAPDIGDPQWLRAFALTNTRHLSSYWADPAMRGLVGLPPAVLEAASRAGSVVEPWAHYLWDGARWGSAKTGVQFAPASAELDALLRISMHRVHFIDLFDTPDRRQSINVATGPERQCLYMTLN